MVVHKDHKSVAVEIYCAMVFEGTLDDMDLTTAEIMEADLRVDLEMDSLAKFEYTQRVLDTVGVEIAPDLIEDCHTMADIVALLDQHAG